MSTSDAGVPTPVPGAPAAPAPASSATSDVLTLRSGVELRGTAVDVRVGQTVTIRLPTGELRVIAWGELASASGPAFQAAAARAASTAPSSATTAGNVSAPPAPSATGVRAGLLGASDEDDTPATMLSARDYRRQRPGTVPVVVESDGEPLSVSIVVPLGVTTVPATSGLYGGSGLYTSGGLYGGGLYGGGLYGGGLYGGGLYGSGLSGSGLYGGGFNGYPPSYGYGGLGGYVVRTSTQQRVCNTPCTIYLRPGAHTLHLGGEGRRESNEAIEVGPTGARVRFHSASQAGHTLGQVFMWTGGGALILGGLLALDAAGGRCMVLPGCNLTLPVALLVGGGLAIGVGIPLLVVNRTGSVTMSPATPRVRETAALRVGLSATPLPGGALGAVGGVF